MTQRSCRACGGWHDVDEPWPEACYGHFRINHNRSDLSAPTIIKDGIDAVQSQLTGKWYESKSSLRTEYKAHNVIELGNEAYLAPEKVHHLAGEAEDGYLIDVVHGHRHLPVEVADEPFQVHGSVREVALAAARGKKVSR